jgi:hypothetical protein
MTETAYYSNSTGITSLRWPPAVTFVRQPRLHYAPNSTRGCPGSIDLDSNSLVARERLDGERVLAERSGLGDVEPLIPLGRRGVKPGNNRESIRISGVSGDGRPERR